jgi:hypothetical protein
MRKVILVVAVLLVAASAFAGGANCQKDAAKAVKLAGTIECMNGDCTEAQLVADAERTYTICCETSKVKLASLNGAKVRVSGKLVKCSESGVEELVVESARKI